MKSFKIVCLTLAFVLFVGALGFGGYKLFSSEKSGNTTHADNVAKIYNVDVNAFDYGFQNIEDGFYNGVLISSDTDLDLSNKHSVVRFLNTAFKNSFTYDDPNDDSVAITYNDGCFGIPTGSVYGYYNSSSNTTPLFWCYVTECNGEIVVRFSKTSNVTAGTIDVPNSTNDCFSYELNDGYIGQNVIYYSSANFVKADYIESDLITSAMSENDMENIISQMFVSITDSGKGLTYSTEMAGYSLSLDFGNGWYGFSQPGTANYPHSTIKVIARFVDGGVYLMLLYFNFSNISTSIFVSGDNYFSTEELAENYISRYEYKLSEDFTFVESKVIPYLNNKYFFNGFQVNYVNSNYSFSNINQAKAMLGITDEDGKFSMTARTDYVDYIEYSFNLLSDNLSLDFIVKVYKNNVCVLDYDKYYYVDKNGDIQTFSVEDITKENSPFVYYYETQTDYYYLRRIDVLTSYQLKISKEILSLNLNKEVA